MMSLHSNNKKSLLYRFVTSYSMVILLILMLGLFFMFSVHSSSKEYTYRQNYTLFKESIEKNDAALRLLSTLATQIGSNTSMTNLANQTEINAYYRTLAAETMTYLSDITALQSLLPLDNFYVYLPETDHIISPTIFMDLDLFYRFERSYKPAQYNDWYQMLTSYDNSRTLISLKNYQSQSTSYLYKVPLSSFASDTFHPAIACFELKLDGMEHNFNNILESYSTLHITDENNVPLLSITGTIDFEKTPENFSTLVDEKSAYATEKFRSGFNTNTVTKIISSYNGWQYYLVQPTSYLLNDLTVYQLFYIAVILIVCVLTFGIIYTLSKANVKPYEAMTNRLETSQKENLSLQDALLKQRPLVYSAYLARIMRGSVSTEQDIKEITDFLQIKGLNKRHFFVLYISVQLEQLENYTNETAGSHNAHHKLHEYENVLSRSFYNFFGNDILIYHPDVNKFALLLSNENDLDHPSVIDDIRSSFQSLHDHLLNDHALWISGGLGGSNTKLPYFWKSYQQAKEALSYTSDETIFQAHKLLQRSNEVYYYPFEMEHQLGSFIQTSNTLQIAEIFKLLRRENEEFRTLSSDSAKLLITDLHMTLIKLRYGLKETQENKDSLNEFDYALSTAKTLDDMEKTALLLSSFFKKKQESNQLIVTIRDYLDKNYFDAELSLKKISEEFSISESYFSYLFKSETGKNFSEYLEELRMSQALILIRETDTPLSELYGHLGYNNPNSFRRAFKKVYGDSPKTFRTSGGISEAE